jgi:large subunit ribosomal protein L3
VSGISKGKGFQGVMKRHNFKGGPGGHGSHFHRAPGSIGASADPARVFPGTRLPGQMGNKKITQVGLTVVATDSERNLLLVKGAIPGSTGSLVVVRG